MALPFAAPTVLAFAAPTVLAFAALAILALAALTASAEPIDERALTDWLHRYEQAWESRDALAASSIFTEDALYYETPYAEPFRGRKGIADYWAGVTADQRDVDFTSEVIAVKDDVGVAHWNAKLTAASTGERVELDGIFVLRFGEDGLVSELKEWWVLRP
jgi:uncharacterized protein (TIGR02246 family)